MAAKRKPVVYDKPSKFSFQHGSVNSDFSVIINATIRNDGDGKKWETVELLVAELLRISRIFDRD